MNEVCLHALHVSAPSRVVLQGLCRQRSLPTQQQPVFADLLATEGIEKVRGRGGGGGGGDMQRKIHFQSCSCSADAQCRCADSPVM